MGKLDKAEEHLTRSFPVLLKIFGRGSGSMKRLLEDIERLYGALQQPDKAARFRDRITPPGAQGAK